MFNLIIVRHGESQWNQENRFTGWVDVPLSAKGVEEAKRGGQALKQSAFQFDVVYTSVLKRAIHTMDLILAEMDQVWLPVHKEWRLNERHYGALQGLNKSETAAKHGEEQVKIWRRSFDVPPPQMSESEAGHPSQDRRYNVAPKSSLPSGESLKQTIERVLPLWMHSIAPRVLKGENVLIVAHGNSLRALIQYLEGLSPEQIMEVNMPTGIPLQYTLDEKLGVISKKFIGDADVVKSAIESVAQQGKKK